MGLRINQNVAAMNSYRNLSNTDNQLSKSLEKLSSGFRINRAADDAAGLAISEGLRSQVGGLKVAVRNSQDGISVVQTAEGALNESHSILQRMRDLSVQASNEGGLNDKAKEAIHKEVSELASELTRIADTTKFNGNALLDGSFDKAFQVGANVGEKIGVALHSGTPGTGFDAADLGVGTLDVRSAGTAGTPASDDYAPAVAASDDYQAAVPASDDYQAAVPASDDYQAAVPASDDYQAAVPASDDYQAAVYDPDTGVEVSPQVGTAGTPQVGTAGTPQVGTAGTPQVGTAGTPQVGTAGTPQVGTAAVAGTPSGAESAITAIDTAIEKVSTARADLGAKQNRFEHTINNLNVTVENLSASESRIRDADMAQEMMQFTRNQILSQAGTAMLAQANQASQGVLSLLR